jgi:hypothetical protein
MITVTLLIIILFIAVFGEFIFWFLIIAGVILLIHPLKIGIEMYKLQKEMKAWKEEHCLDPLKSLTTAHRETEGDGLWPAEADTLPGQEDRSPACRTAFSERLRMDKEKQLRLAAYPWILPGLIPGSFSAQHADADSQAFTKGYHSRQSEVKTILAGYQGSHLQLAAEFGDRIAYMQAFIPYIESEQDYRNRNDFKRFQLLENAVDRLLEIHDEMA